MATSVQYGIRHLMVLTLVVAVVMAVLGPMIRAWDTERQFVFTIYLAASLLLLAGYTCCLCRWRVRAERDAGEVILRIRASDSPLAKGLWFAINGILVLLMFASVILLSG